MGREKGLVNFRGKPLVSYAINSLEPVVDTLIIGTNEQLDEYRKFGHAVITDEIEGIGPMGGLLTTLKHSKTEHNLILSCDMPFVSTELMDYLFQNVQDYDIVVAVHGKDRIEPLCGYYARRVTSILEKSIQNRNYALRSIFGQVRFKTLKVDESLPFYSENLFYNVNRPEDLHL